MRDFIRGQYLVRALGKLKPRISVLCRQDIEMSAINNNALPVMPRGSRAIVSEDVYQALSVIQEVSAKEKIEVPFLLFGHTEGQTVVFDDYAAHVENHESMQANFSKFLNGSLNDFVKNSVGKRNLIVAHGHSHPQIGRDYLNFSLGDMAGYIQMRDNFRKDNLEVCSVLLTGGNYNFLFFDGNDFYKFNKCYVQRQNGDLQELSCYQNDVLKQNIYNMGGRQ